MLTVDGPVGSRTIGEDSLLVCLSLGVAERRMPDAESAEAPATVLPICVRELILV